MNRADLGHMGEAVAAKYYIRQGYLLLNLSLIHISEPTRP